MEKKSRKKRENIDWNYNVSLALEWIKKCREIGIEPTTSQLQKKFGWTQTISSKVKSFIKIIESKENE
jgi:hypothetical protein